LLSAAVTNFVLRMLQRTVLSSLSGAHLNSLYAFNSLICTTVCMLFLLLFMLCCFVRIQ